MIMRSWEHIGWKQVKHRQKQMKTKDLIYFKQAFKDELVFSPDLLSKIIICVICTMFFLLNQSRNKCNDEICFVILNSMSRKIFIKKEYNFIHISYFVVFNNDYHSFDKAFVTY